MGGTQRHSVALNGTQRHSAALSGTQWHSGTHMACPYEAVLAGLDVDSVPIYPRRCARLRYQSPSPRR
jgi:hypothetical protein